MTVTRGQTATGVNVNSATTAVLTFATNPAAGAKVLVFAGGTVAPSGVADNGTTPKTFTRDAHFTSGTFGLNDLSVWRADGITLPASGNYKVTVTFGSAAFGVTGARSYAGVATGAPSATNSGSGTSGSVTTGNVTPPATGSLVFGGFVDDTSSGSESVTLTTSGANSVYSTGNGAIEAGAAADNIVTTTSAQGLAWTLGDSPDWAGVVAVYAVAPPPGAAALSGTGTLTASGLVVVPGAAVLSGTGTLTATVALAVPAAVFLLGTGTLTPDAGVTAPGQVAANLAGTGTLSTAVAVGWAQAATLSGTGTLTAQYTGSALQAVTLAGTGTIAVAVAEALTFTAGLFGAGFLSIPQVAGGLVNGVGGASTPQALPGSSQVAVAPPGSSNWQWLGTLGQVTALTYSYVCPGGCDQMTCSIMVPASFRTQLFNPGWQVKITRGGHQVWDGKLDEPQPSAQGWTLTAVGTGNLGASFTSFYSPDDLWPEDEPDEIINRAIGRGLPWVNPGLNSSPYFSQFWMGQAIDPGSSTVTAFLNLICTRGGLTWYVNSQPGGIYNGDDLSVFPLPTVPNRLLVATTPVARTLGGDINTILIRYVATADNTTTGVPAAYNVVSAINAASVAAHGTLETYIDLSDVGQMSSSAAQAVGNAALLYYQRASFAGPFQASYGQLLNTGGAAIDPGTDQAGTVIRMILTDWGLGGEVQPGPIDVICGSYSWDDFQQIATITPMQTLDMSLTGLLSAWSTVNTPITVAS